MSTYLPVVIGNTHELRTGIESTLSTSPEAIAKRLEQLDAITQAAGRRATFGAEIEFQFVEDPMRPEHETRDVAVLHDDVVMKVLGTDEMHQPLWRKGQVVHPRSNPGPIMLSDLYSDQGQGIIELRTGPAGALEATERYWRIVQAIGQVAEEKGYMGLILSTHMNAAFYNEKAPDYGFIRFGSPEGGRLLAMIEHNRRAMDILQLDSGLECGVKIQEAFPGSKDTTTVVHQERLELRHPLVGLADPRIDMLAVLDGLYQTQTDNIPKTALNQLRTGFIYDWTAANYYLADALKLAFVDGMSGQLTLAAALESSTRVRSDEVDLGSFVRMITGDHGYTVKQDDGLTVRNIIGDLCLRDNDLHITTDNWYNPNLLHIMQRYLMPYNARPQHRILPVATYDSPSSHTVRRAAVRQSASIRRILGDASSTLTPAKEAIATRSDLVDAHMVVSDAPLE